MRIKIKKVYYCEYCNKHSLRPLIKHEKHCTANIDRECRMCDFENIVAAPDIKKLIKKFNSQFKVKTHRFNYVSDYDEYETVEEYPKANDILDSVNFCPACALTIIKKLDHHVPDFNYQNEVAKYWNYRNEASN